MATTASADSTPITSRWAFPGNGNVADDPAELAALARRLRIPNAAARILWNRGYRDPAVAARFLDPRLEDLHDPFLLKDMDRAVERVRDAFAAHGEKIEIHGDYDVDGVTSTVVLKKAMEMAGGDLQSRLAHPAPSPRWHMGYSPPPLTKRQRVAFA